MMEINEDVFDEKRLEIENRIKNLVWTVSKDYCLEAKPDADAFMRSKDAAFYDAIKQGAFAYYYDKEEFSMYIVKKIYCEADEQALMNLAQMAIDMAVHLKITEERPGVEQIRRRAFEDVLDQDFHKLVSSLPGKVKAALMRGSLTGDWSSERRISWAVDKIRSLENAGDTMQIIETVDELYNSLIDREFEKKHGTLEHVLAVTMEELAGYDWNDFMEEEAAEEYLEQISNRMTATGEEDPEEQQKRKRRASTVILNKEDIDKMYSYMELNFGKSYLSEADQKKADRKLCRGAHADCSLYYTEGILKNPVKVNAQYVNAKKQADRNRLVTKRNIEIMTNELRHSLIQRSEIETISSDYGQLVPSRLWKAGRCEPRKLFEKLNKKDNSDFVVEILMDASGSQRGRQSQVALQGYIREASGRIFEYNTTANNRDGLAIRASGDSLLERPEENKILIVLSDGRPNDVIVNRPGSRNPRTYSGEYAVSDTAFEVRRLRKEGIFVLGVFAGREKDLAAEKRIFGRDFAYIRQIGNFSNVVGLYLKKLLEWE